MKNCIRIAFALSFILTAASVFAQADAQQSFNKLKALTGNWVGTTSDGRSVEVEFRETSAGSALMSEIKGDGKHHMISMFNLDGPNKLVITHYCSAGNQPRMVAAPSSDGKTFTFTFVDGMNIPDADSGHMQTVAFAVTDASHHTETWTYIDHGKTHDMVFDLHRKG